MKYRVVIDLGWHDADTAAQAVFVATNKKYKSEGLGYIAVSEQELNVQMKDTCVPSVWTREDQVDLSWDEHEERGDYYEFRN